MPRSPSLYPSALAGTHLRSRRAALACIAASGALWLAACEAPQGFKGIDITGADYARDFSLADVHGQTRRLADFRGRVVMLYFGFVQCPDVCPTALARAAAVMEALGPQAQDLQVIFVTVDPERDTPELLREYMAAFHPSFLALSGSLADIQQTATAFRAYYKKVPTGSGYTMDHSSLSYLFDRQGQVRIALRHEQSVEDYAADIRLLLAETAR